MSKKISAVALAILLAGCVTGQTTSFRAGAGQIALVRDGRPSVASDKAKTSVVLVPSARQAPVGARSSLVVAIQNRSAQPLTFRLAGVHAEQRSGEADGRSLKVFTYEDLVAEEQARQVAAAILVGVAAGANAAAASHSSRNPYVSAWNQHVATRENSEMMSSVAAQGSLNLATLEKTIIKDNTLMPGEWYGGVMQIEPPATSGPEQSSAYSLDIEVGGEHHVFEVTQNPIKS